MAILPNLAPLKVYWHNPAPLFAARVNMPGAITYPIQDITYDGVTTGAYTDLAADMFFTLGSEAGLDDYGRGRLRGVPSATTLFVGRSSQGTEDGQLDVADNAYITVYADYRVHAKIPRITPDAEYKDADAAVGTWTQTPPPVATMGPPRARRIDADTGKARFYFDGASSYAVADGATITGHAWDIGDGEFALGSVVTDPEVYVDFPAGVRYVALTVTDDNGRTHTTRRLVLADDPDDSLCVSGMQVTRLERRLEGAVARLRVLEDLPRAAYPDGSQVIIWEDRDPALFGTPSPADLSDVRFWGWHSVDEASSVALETHLRRETELTCVDVAGRLDQLPGFNQRVEKPDDDDEWTWGEMDAPNMDKFLHYLIHWHSTAAAVADLYLSGTWDDYPFVLFDAVGDTLFNQLSRQAQRFVPDHQLTCDRYGALRVRVDPMLQDPGDRTSTIHNSVTDQAWSEIEFGYQRAPRVHTLRGSAVLTGTDYELDDDGAPVIPTAFAIAPGTAPGQGGREQTIGERLAQSQADLNACIGHHFARQNARYGLITLTLNANADPWGFDPASLTWVQLVLGADSAPQRGLDFTTIRCLCREVSIDYQYGEEGTTTTARVVLERETVGLPALTEEDEEVLPVGEQPAPPVVYVPDFGLVEGVQQVAALVWSISAVKLSIVRTSDFGTPSGSGGPTWSAVDISSSVVTLPGGGTPDLSWVVDPFSPGYRGVAGGDINGFLITNRAIYKVTDLFGTPSVNALQTFSSDIDPRRIGASFGRYFAEETDNPWLIAITNYRNISPYREQVIFSMDGGQTWSGENKLTAFSSTNQLQYDGHPIWMSPRTPGRAITGGLFSSSSGIYTVKAYETTDWGDTWAELTSPAIVPINAHSMAIHVPWHDNEDELLVYHGTMQQLTSPTRWLYRLKRVTDATIEDISPSDTGKTYGPEGYPFSLRAFDSNRQYLAMAGISGDTGFSGSDISHAVFVSDDFGDTWTRISTIYTGTTDSIDRPYEIAFGGDSQDVLFAWGYRYMRYSDDFGATLDNRMGNMTSGAGGNLNIYGIAGGPTA